VVIRLYCGAAPAHIQVFQHQWRGKQFRRPVRNGSVFIFHVKVNLRVRIPVIPLRDDPVERDRLVRLIRNVASVMSQRGKTTDQ